ncbi:hypothetical protein SAMN05444920_13070 [Nonomuraea solani]|uniref:Uncharacterized protein n=1 Tax=Nonomuraea solani TaxID=1144553 RepID=A0A1H6F0Y2_9ACTN|nr:hypothetical protein [Nonomuraea solani]SEH02846.1 hypothetical protein SAMN05444920_13070 [Nonomuraea solani]
MSAVRAVPPFSQRTVTGNVPALAVFRLGDHVAAGVPGRFRVGVNALEAMSRTREPPHIAVTFTCAPSRALTGDTPTPALTRTAPPGSCVGVGFGVADGVPVGVGAGAGLLSPKTAGRARE